MQFENKFFIGEKMLRPKLIDVMPTDDYKLLLAYSNGEDRLFDVKPYIKGEWYGELANKAVFNTVRLVDGWTIEWQGGQDISPDDLYELSVNVDLAQQHLIIPKDKEEAIKFLHEQLLSKDGNWKSRPVDEVFEEVRKKYFGDNGV